MLEKLLVCILIKGIFFPFSSLPPSFLTALGIELRAFYMLSALLLNNTSAIEYFLVRKYLINPGLQVNIFSHIPPSWQRAVIWNLDSVESYKGTDIWTKLRTRNPDYRKADKRLWSWTARVSTNNFLSFFSLVSKLFSLLSDGPWNDKCVMLCQSPSLKHSTDLWLKLQFDFTFLWIQWWQNMKWLHWAFLIQAAFTLVELTSAPEL